MSSRPARSQIIPLSRPDITQADIDAVSETLLSGILTAGARIEELESRCAALTGRRHGVAVSSGTAALHCTMIAAGIKPGDEIVTTPFSFVASANAPLYVDARPVFVDIEQRSLNIDTDLVEAAITPRTKAIIAVEALGHPAGIDKLEQIARRNELILIEDAAEGFGGKLGQRPLGNFGRASVFSFYPNKQITTGEGGMIVTDDDKFADHCRSIRNMGRDGMAWLAHRRLGYNYRLSELHAALGCAQLERLDEILESRREATKWYMEFLMDSKWLILPTFCEADHPSWFVFVVRLNDLFEPGDRDLAMRLLRMRGIGCNNYFPPIHLQPYMRERFGFAPGMLPVCEYVAERTLALPFFTAITKAQVERVCETLNQVLEQVLTGRSRA